MLVQIYKIYVPSFMLAIRLIKRTLAGDNDINRLVLYYLKTVTRNIVT